MDGNLFPDKEEEKEKEKEDNNNHLLFKIENILHNSESGNLDKIKFEQQLK